MVDYSKWDKIELLSDSDEEQHPNIDKNLMKRLTKEKKLRKRHEEEMQLKKVNEELERLKAQVSSASEEDRQKLSSEIKIIEKRIQGLEKNKKIDESTMCKEGFSKTIMSKPKVTEKPEPEIAQVEGDEEKLEQDMDEYVKNMELLAHQLASKIHDYDLAYEFIKEHPEIVCEETVSYMLLHSSDSIKKHKYSNSKMYLKTSQVVKYCLELGKDGIFMFFHNEKPRKVFEEEVTAYWERIKEKVTEMQADKKKRKLAKWNSRKENGVEVPENYEDVSTDEDFFEDHMKTVKSQ
ncbi:hypothetical protein ROZALSC1DRAFT_28008 [Rozella allomycis CSF55]|uniref:Hsp90 chaperone protein kinase-targeting subunit n=1 Tax=Rozella allomycis (strain CSF55) TaxID=988480 RepID=A0A075B0A3_ROZAC|nr:hypothetical protein O9G_001832 [Rozella allomycis CSF55]RKP20503.1 hypothetical protein ROZALSC1DRAFT_28008 [Rozella allomycis CSF55]|eukprot:EPZ34219.1 hypothetical protein O9G_001832 [Rozella allomycis CSF55]